MEKEIWRPVVGFENYEVSNLGRVKSLERYIFQKDGKVRLQKECILKPILDKWGYCRVTLYDGNRQKIMQVHRLVALAFLENPDNLPCINHKDECKTNNNASNLEFCTQKYNVHYSRGWEKGQPKAVEKTSKPVLQFTKSGGLVAEYKSAKEAGRQTNIKDSSISKCCLKKPHHHTAGGFIWRYK